MADLRACVGCARHIFSAEAECPFCNAVQVPRARGLVRFKPGVSRAQRFGLAAVALASQLLVGCDDELDSEMNIPLYGAPIPNDASDPSGGDGDEDATVPER